MANDYLSLDDFKALFPDNAPSGHDALLTSLITEASRAIDRLCKKLPGAFKVTTDSTRYYDGSTNYQLWIDELAAAPTSVGVAETGIVDGSNGTGGTYTTYAATDYLLWPYNALADGVPFIRLDLDLMNGSRSSWYRYPKCVKITGKFGYSAAVPSQLALAVGIMATRYFKRAQQGFGDAAAIQELSQIQYLRQIDPDVAIILDSLGGITI